MGFVQVRLEVVAVNICPVCTGFGREKHRTTLVLIIYLYLRPGSG